MPSYNGVTYKSVSRMFAMQVWGTWDAIPPDHQEKILKLEAEQDEILKNMPKVDMRPLKQRRYLK